MKPGSLIQYMPNNAPTGSILANAIIIGFKSADPGKIYTCTRTFSYIGRHWLQVEEMSFGIFPDGIEVWCNARLWVEVQTPPDMEIEITEALKAPAPQKEHFVEL